MFVNDDSSWPLVVTRFPTLMTLENSVPFVREAEGLLARHSPFVWLILVEHPRLPSAETRLFYANWLRVNRESLNTYLSGVVIVTPTVLSRLAVRTIFLMQPPDFPYAVMRSERPARVWCASKLRSRGILPPDALRDSDPVLPAVEAPTAGGRQGTHDSS